MTEEAFVEIRKVAEQAALVASDIIREGLAADPQSHTVELKGAVDLVTEVDRQAEEAILTLIRGRFPDHSILAEESGETGGGDGFQWFIDPLDGTTNFAHHHPHLAVSLACLMDGEPVVGVISDPGRGEMFTAQRGEGAYLNGRPISVSRCDDLSRCLLATGFPYDRIERSQHYVPIFEAFMRRTQGVRRMGAAALDLAWVACGRMDGFWEPGLNPWDVGAGVLLVSEAGGQVTDYVGEPLDLTRPKRIVASNSRIHEDMLRLLARYRNEWE